MDRTGSRRGRSCLHRLTMMAGACAIGLAVWSGSGGVGLAITTGPAVVLTQADEADLQRIVDKLNDAHSVRSVFVQSSSNGETAQGNLYLSRPGRLRIDYQPPSPLLVVADGNFLIYYDKRLEQVSYIPLDSTPASILLQDRLSLSDGKLTITGFQRSGGMIRLGVTRTASPGEGSITLIFDQSSLALSQWQVTDAQGVVTMVSLIDPQFNVKLDKELFRFEDPRSSSPHAP